MRGAAPSSSWICSGQPDCRLNEPRSLRNRPGLCVTNAFSCLVARRAVLTAGSASRLLKAALGVGHPPQRCVSLCCLFEQSTRLLFFP